MTRLTNLITIVGVLSLAATALGFLGRWHYLPDLFSHFRIQLSVMLLTSSILLYFLESRHWSILNGTVGIVLLVSLWPFLWPAATESSHYRLVSLNVLTSNSRKADVIDFIVDSDPDYVVLLETDQEWVRQLNRALLPRWPHHKSTPRSDNFGVVLYSKHPWVSCDIVEYSAELGTPSLSALFDLPDSQQLRLIAVHPAPPMTSSLWKSRNSLFTSLAKDVKARVPNKTIVAGDLNCTPWSYWFKRLQRDSGLRTSAYGHGVNVSWKPFPLPLGGLPIDHALVGEQVKVATSDIGPDVGSDHRPLVVDFSLN